jgi:hypothetical protein
MRYIAAGEISLSQTAKEVEISTPLPLFDFGLVPSLSTGRHGKDALSNFKTSAL